MAEKRVRKAETTEGSMTEMPAPEGSRVVVYRREPEPDDWYDVGAWKGIPHFRCRLCAFDTMRADALMDHLGLHGSATITGSEPVQTLERDASADLGMTTVEV